ncbi:MULTISPECIES: HIT domain-containing protein [unclassified Oceanobacillus]|uniref:HIT domain-containing protein n=1 Tax=unclassified Oceanobacillus TaxID=2630292 RepID=UPI001BEA5BB9|nr:MULTISPECIES: HIT domain-containing protein [unclassified Oceanobacillus]MBT2598918.1 HIT domain-containing protein [Oceanobacillus sp. ISL-74]MBT2651837.1 HIT domain-containing protein [Oceanobacillus sp. ISL-73]
MEYECVFCKVENEPLQSVILSNEYTMFLQLNDTFEKGAPLEGAGGIVPKAHRETVFDLSEEEWRSTFDLLKEAKKWIDVHHQPNGYNIGWNAGKTAGQHIFHSHLHILPRYDDEKYIGKGIRALFKQSDNRTFKEVPYN